MFHVSLNKKTKDISIFNVPSGDSDFQTSSRNKLVAVKTIEIALPMYITGNGLTINEFLHVGNISKLTNIIFMTLVNH